MNGHKYDNSDLSHSWLWLLVRHLFEDLKRDPRFSWTVKEVKDLEKDLSTIFNRLAKEGISFLTETLPKFAKAFEGTTEVGWIARVPISSAFKSTPCVIDGVSHTRVPVFLRSLTRHIISDDDLAPYALKHVRQVCYLMYKLELPSDPEKDQEAVDNFLQIESYLSHEHTIDSDPDFYKAVETCRSILATVDVQGLYPKHGPVKVSTGETG